MKLETFQRLMEFCGYHPEDKKRTALMLVMTQGASQRSAATAVGYSPTQLNQVYSRVRREVARLEKFLGRPLQ